MGTGLQSSRGSATHSAHSAHGAPGADRAWRRSRVGALPALRRLPIGIVVALLTAGSVTGQVIDDFESYLDSTDIKGYWKFADLDTTASNAFDGTQSLVRGGLDVPNNSGLNARANFSGPYLDLSPAEGLRVRVRRDPSSVDVVFRVIVLDTFGQNCQAQSATGLAPGEWFTVVLDFDDCPNHDPSEIEQITLSLTNKSGVAGDVRGNFDRVEAVFAAIFSDGFEAGDLSAWQPAAP